MGILDGLEPPAHVRSCKVRTILEGLDAADRKILEAALADDVKWNKNALARALFERGFRIKADTLGIHRRKECSCSKA